MSASATVPLGQQMFRVQEALTEAERLRAAWMDAVQRRAPMDEINEAHAAFLEAAGSLVSYLIGYFCITVDPA